MASVSIRFNTEPWSEVLEDMSDRLGDLDTIMDQIGAYMVRSVQNRILRQKRTPSGERWAPLKDSTIDIKGHDRALFDSGDLYRSVSVTETGDDGFVISADSDHAEYMQFGVNSTGGWIKGKRVPARPFMGFSDANRQRIARMLRDYIANGSVMHFGGAE